MLFSFSILLYIIMLIFSFSFVFFLFSTSHVSLLVLMYLAFHPYCSFPLSSPFYHFFYFHFSKEKKIEKSTEEN
ncbi:hypothetical protein STCU_11600 [Strigomonas culicis]|uniref:Uncharacterized protein n=1 Tax=Strigomonas culicis TaxID=28005 RepID=S9TI53_9TRYP|nr:hypothetical protein STCU_11600 [Strigomonas culicis]|eukprot:EPY16023.1 hypothetical protein STCU_11600 [Strigomonas culicis]